MLIMVCLLSCKLGFKDSSASKLPQPQVGQDPPQRQQEPSPSMPPPLHLAKQQEQQVPSGRVVTLRPKLSAAINTCPQTQQEPCRVGDGSSTPASLRVPTVAVPPDERSWHTSPPATLGVSVGSRGKEAALLLLVGVLGETADSISCPGSTLIFHDVAELYGKRQFPGRDTAAHHEFM